MKYLKRYNESTTYKLDKSSIEEILDIFNDLGDEGFDIINKDLLDQPFYSPGKSEITYQMSTDELDDKGKDEYSSTYKPKKHFWTDDYLDGMDPYQVRSKYFNYYQQIIFNVNLESFSDSDLKRIKDICIGIYDRLISCGYRCQLWEPGYKKLRYHISTDESNPFMVTKNSLKESYIIKESLTEDAKDIFIDHKDMISIAAQYQNGERDIVMYIYRDVYTDLTITLEEVRDEVHHLVSHMKSEGYKLERARLRNDYSAYNTDWTTIYNSNYSSTMDIIGGSYGMGYYDSDNLNSLELKFSLED
jgi:hypothetical protein